MIQKSTHAYTLVEMTIALALTSLLSLMAGHWIAHAHLSLGHTARRVTRVLAISSAQEVLRRDLQQAPADRGMWKVEGGAAPTWHAIGNDICWSIEKNTLYRVQGSYDVKQQRWLESTKSKVADNVEQLVIMPVVNKNNTIVAVQGRIVADIDGQQEIFAFSELVRNGEVA